MAYFSYNKLWESKFDNIVSKKDKVHSLISTKIKLAVHDTYKKDQKLTTYFEAVNDEDVMNKAYLDEKTMKIDGHLSLLEKDYNEFEL